MKSRLVSHLKLIIIMEKIGNTSGYCIFTHNNEIMFKEILWKWWITRSLHSRQISSLRLEPWSKTLQSHSYENFHKKSQENEGDVQLCEAQRAGYEVVVQLLILMWSQDDFDAILLVDTDNTFNWINQNVTLHNIWIICPIIATYVTNSYRQEVMLFIHEEIQLLHLFMS